MIVVLVIEALLIVAHLAMPVMSNMSLSYRAAGIVREMDTVRRAAENARASSGQWPGDEPAGQVPEKLMSFLPPGYSFVHKDHQLDWDAWTLRESSALDAKSNQIAAISVVTHDIRLSAAVARRLRDGETRLTLDRRTTLVIAEPPAVSP